MPIGSGHIANVAERYVSKVFDVRGSVFVKAWFATDQQGLVLMEPRRGSNRLNEIFRIANFLDGRLVPNWDTPVCPDFRYIVRGLERDYPFRYPSSVAE